MAGIVQVVIVHLMLKAVQMVNLIVVMANVFMAHGHVTVMVTEQMAQMKLTVVVAAVPMVNLLVLMDHVFMVHGHATDMVTVQMVLTKLIAAAEYQMIGHVQMVIILIHGVTVDVVHTIQYVMIQTQVNGLTVALEKNV